MFFVGTWAIVQLKITDKNPARCGFAPLVSHNNDDDDMQLTRGLIGWSKNLLGYFAPLVIHNDASLMMRFNGQGGISDGLKIF